jgi:hypothetical protein
MTWTLVSSETTAVNGTKRQFYGANPKGILILDADSWTVTSIHSASILATVSSGAGAARSDARPQAAGQAPRLLRS